MSKIILKSVRLSFPSLFSTEVYNGTDTEKYTATFLLDKDEHKDVITALKKEMVACAEEKFGKPVPKSVKMSLKDGAEVEYDGYENCFSIKASTKKRPTVLNRDKTPLAAEDDVIYAGCYVNASISLWAMDNQYGKRVLANLNGVQFVKEGPAFGAGGGSAADDFDDLGSDDAGDEVDPFS